MINAHKKSKVGKGSGNDGGGTSLKELVGEDHKIEGVREWTPWNWEGRAGTEALPRLCA